MKRMLKQCVSAIVLSTSALAANAIIIDNGNSLTDTDTGLEWLDVTQTVGMSYAFVSGQFGSGQAFDGWRYATGDEFNNLLTGWTNVANNGYGWTDTTGTTPSVDGLVSLLGSTLDSQYVRDHGVTYDENYGRAEGDAMDEVRGILGDQVNAGRYVGYILDREEHDDFAQYSALDGFSTHYESLAHDFHGAWNLGSFLVRSTGNGNGGSGNNGGNGNTATVSEPAPLALLGLGLFGLGLVRKRASK